MEGARDPPESWGKRRAGSVTVVFLAALPLLLLLFLFGDRAASIAADSQLWFQVKQQSPRKAAPPAHDRLLGGLLSPAIDARVCRSRYESSKRWKPSPFPVPPYLVRKLRAYEANHRRCGPGTARYREAIAQLKSGRNGDRGECRYVVWFPIQGLGNRMLSLVSTFLYALLTGRVVLLREPAEMDGLYCEPFPGTSWRLPADFPYKDKAFWSNCPESYATMLESKVIGYDGVDASALPAYVYLHLENMNLRIQNHTFCEEDHRALDSFNWIVLRSDSYFAVPLFLVPTYQEELERMFPAKGAVFNHLGRYLLHPGNRAWGIMQRFYDGYLAGADERLGVQVRVVPANPTIPFDIMFEHIERCARENGLLPQVTDQPASAVPPANSTAEKPKTKAVLLVSLKPEYYDKFHGTYYANATANGEVVTVYQPSHEQDQHTEARSHNERALAEIFLLSYCDTLVTTSWSTFGYVAHALAGVRPWIVTPNDWSGRKADTACVRAASVEPCLHSQLFLECRSGKNLDAVAQLPFVRHCEDAGSGLKLVD